MRQRPLPTSSPRAHHPTHPPPIPEPAAHLHGGRVVEGAHTVQVLHLPACCHQGLHHDAVKVLGAQPTRHRLAGRQSSGTG